MITKKFREERAEILGGMYIAQLNLAEPDHWWLEIGNREMGYINKLDEIIPLLVEARDTVQASLAENGISDERKAYRKGLYDRLNAVIKQDNTE